MPTVCVCGRVAEVGDIDCSLCGRGLAPSSTPQPHQRAPEPTPSTPTWAPPLPRGGPRTGGLLPRQLAAVALLVLGLALAAVLVLLNGRSVDERAASSSVTPMATEGSTAPVLPTDLDLSTPSPPASPSGYPTVTLTGRPCGQSGDGPQAAAAAGNDQTTCPFALNVGRAYHQRGAAGEAVELTVYSPVTERWYEMTCSGDQPAVCTGGNDAVVYLYGGEAVFSG